MLVEHVDKLLRDDAGKALAELAHLCLDATLQLEARQQQEILGLVGFEYWNVAPICLQVHDLDDRVIWAMVYFLRERQSQLEVVNVILEEILDL